MKKEIYILGVGNNTIVTIDLAEACGYTVACLYHYDDSRTGELYYGHRIIGSSKELFSSNLKGMIFAISVGDNHKRAEIFELIKQAGGNIVTLIHPESTVSKYSEIGKGCCIHAGATVCAGTKIGDNCVVSFGAVVVHGAKMADHSFIAAAGILGANIVLEEYAFIGLNATTISNKVERIGAEACVGAGAVVTKPVIDAGIVAGNPAQILKIKELISGG